MLHDLIPLSHPEYCDPAIAGIFPTYVAFLAGARKLIANSVDKLGSERAERWWHGVSYLIESLGLIAMKFKPIRKTL